MFQFINRQIGFMCCLLVVALTMALMPHLPSVNLLFFIFAINGFATGGIEASTDVWVVEMWGHDCGPYVQALHFVFGVGSIITPLVVEPFLSESPKDNIDLSEFNDTRHDLFGYNETNKNWTHLNQSLFYSTDIASSEDTFETRVYIPYTFLAVIIAICGALCGSLYFFMRYTPPEREIRSEFKVDTKTTKKEETLLERLNRTFIEQLMPTRQILIMIVMCSYLLSLFLSLEWAQFNYFPSFAHFSDLHLSERKAAIISTGMAISFTVGRGVSIPLSHYLSPKLLIYCSLVVLLISEILFLLFANTSETFMWVANIIFGLGLSPIYASIYHMVEEVTPVTNLMGVLFIFMSGLTSSLAPIILGIYIESQPLIMVYFNLICVVLSIVLIIVIHVLIRRCITNSSHRTQTTAINNNNEVISSEINL